VWTLANEYKGILRETKDKFLVLAVTEATSFRKRHWRLRTIQECGAFWLSLSFRKVSFAFRKQSFHNKFSRKFVPFKALLDKIFAKILFE